MKIAEELRMARGALIGWRELEKKAEADLIKARDYCTSLEKSISDLEAQLKQSLETSAAEMAQDGPYMAEMAEWNS